MNTISEQQQTDRPLLPLREIVARQHPIPSEQSLSPTLPLTRRSRKKNLFWISFLILFFLVGASFLVGFFTAPPSSLTRLSLSPVVGLHVLPTLKPTLPLHPILAVLPSPTPTVTSTAIPPATLAATVPITPTSPVSFCPTLCQPTIPAGVTKVSFEDGTTDGWTGQPKVVLLQNSMGYAAEGTHSLRVTLNHITNMDYPYLTVDRSHLSPVPRSGQTISLWVYMPDKTTQLQGKLLVMDNQMNWYSPSVMVKLTSGQWSQLTFIVPVNCGPILQISVQFNSLISSPMTYDIYIDAVGWI